MLVGVLPEHLLLHHSLPPSPMADASLMKLGGIPMLIPTHCLYAEFPGVLHVRIVRDRGTGQSRGFGFVVSQPAFAHDRTAASFAVTSFCCGFTSAKYHGYAQHNAAIAHLAQMHIRVVTENASAVPPTNTSLVVC